MTIYFIEMEKEGCIKIGYTAGSAEKRMAQLQTGQPQKLRLLGTIPGEMKDEKSLHKELRAFRGNGEWFQSNPELRKAVLSLIDGQLPWYFVRGPRLLREGLERMSEEWVSAFSRTIEFDQSSFVVPCMHMTKNNKEKTDMIRKLGLEVSRNGDGEFPKWAKRRIAQINTTPAKKYLMAWTS